jgi:hypothetical protein
MRRVETEFEEKQQAIEKRLADWNQWRREAWRDRKFEAQQRAIEVRRRRLRQAEAKENKLAELFARTEFRDAHATRRSKAVREVERVADQWVRSYIVRQNIAQNRRRDEYLAMQMLERERQKAARLDEIRTERNRQRDVRMRQMRGLLTHYG